MVRPSGWDILGLDGDPTPGVVESVQALAREFGDFAHDVEAAYRSLNSFGSDAGALQWIGQTADAFKGQFGPLPGRLQKLYTSYSEASDALSAYAPQLQAAQTKADAALRQAQDAHTDLQRATSTATNAASDLKTAQQNQAANPDQKAVTDAQTAHDTAQTNLNNAKAQMAALTKQANDAYNDRITAAKTCASALHKAQGDGIHNKSWWDHVGEDLSEWGGKIAEIANDLAPFLDVLALATSWIPGVDVITAALAEADNIIALVGTGMQIAGDAMQGHWGDALMGAGMLGLTFLGGKAIGSLGGKLAGKLGREAEDGVADEARTAEGDAARDSRQAEGNADRDADSDPVDVVSGQVITAEEDLRLHGVLPLILRRAYASDYRTGLLFGSGWASTLDQRLAVNAAGIHFVGDDAQTLDYPLSEAGDEPVLAPRGARWPLVWDRESDEIRISDPGNGVIRHFAAVHYSDDDGQIRDLTAITDRNGNRIDFVRDGQGTPTGIVHSGGYRLTVDTAVTAAGIRVTGLRMPGAENAGDTTVKQYAYDDRGRLVEVVDSTGLPHRYEYDNRDRMTGWVDRVGYHFGYEFDDVSGRVRRGVGDGGFLSADFEYDDEALTTTVTDSMGGRKVYHIDRAGHVRLIVDAAGAMTMFERDSRGRIISTTDALGRTIFAARDDQGRVISVRRPDGSTSNREYDSEGRLCAVSGFDGTVDRYEWDERGNQIASVDATGHRTWKELDQFGRMRRLFDASGQATELVTDGAGLPIRISDPAGACTTITRDRFGRIRKVVDAGGLVTTFGWTVEGRPSWRVDPDGGRSEWHYDANGNLVENVQPSGAVARAEFGPFGYITARTETSGRRLRFAYDTELRMRSATDQAGSTWSYEYDAVGNLAGESDFNGRSFAYRRDAAGQLVGITIPSGHGIDVAYDSLGRIVERSTPDRTYRYEYHRNGRLSVADNGDSSVRYDYDSMGRVLSETVDGRTITFGYDEIGRRSSRTTPTGVVSGWDFDTVGRAERLRLGGLEDLSFLYDATGREIARQIGTGASIARAYDAKGQLATERVLAAATSGADGLVFARSYEYDSGGHPSTISDTVAGTRRIEVDLGGRITGIQADTWNESYAYDSLGNVADSSCSPWPEEAGPRETSGTRIHSSGRTHLDYDQSGRVVRAVKRTLSGQRLVWAYSWDLDDRLVQAALPDGSSWRYRYDPLGRRVAKQEVRADGSVGEECLFTWDGSRLVEQVTRAGDGTQTALTWDYRPGTWSPVAQRTRSWAADAPQAVVDEAFHAIVTDLTGTPTELIDGDGGIAWCRVASAWGRTVVTRAQDGVECPLRSPGQFQDVETGLHYNLHRYYDPATAAYLSPDPLGLTPSPNDYAFVGNPLTDFDPLGLSTVTVKQHNLAGDLVDVEVSADDPLQAYADFLRPMANKKGPHFAVQYTSKSGRTYFGYNGHGLDPKPGGALDGATRIVNQQNALNGVDAVHSGCAEKMALILAEDAEGPAGAFDGHIDGIVQVRGLASPEPSPHGNSVPHPCDVNCQPVLNVLGVSW
jgi:RHS repeat-associated protein